MNRLLIIAGLFAISAAFASQASASTTNVSVTMSFTQPTVPQDTTGACPVFLLGGFCGSGVVVPFGYATESILPGACGDNCDLRTVSVNGSLIYMNETGSDGFCPGSCHPAPGEPGGATLSDTVVGGTGRFEGATGALSGSVFGAGAQSAKIKLAGTITLQT